MSDPLEVLLYGHPTLRERSHPVEVFDASLRCLVEAMEEAMFREDGIGLAAPQVGVLQRVLIASVGGRRGGKIHHFINPHLLQVSRERDSFEEGCLSLPGISADVMRPVRAVIRYQDLLGNEHELHDDGLLARIVQHEHDHLEGTLFVDHLSLIKRKMLAKKLRELQKRALPA